MIYRDITGAISPIEKEGFFPVVEGDKPEKTGCTIIVEDKLVFNEDHWTQLYKLSQAPMYTAGEWLEFVGLGASQQPALIHLKLKLDKANKVSNKINTLEEYLEQILSDYANYNTSRCDWPYPPVLYHEAVSEAISLLQ
jgi:hypothetical protein